MNERLLAELIEILNEEKKLYKKLYESAEQKKDTLINNEIELLFNHVENDREYINKISELEEKRLSVMEDINKAFGINSEELSYQEFINQMPDYWEIKLNPVREELLKILEEFHELNTENKELIKEAVKFNKFSIDLIIDNLDNNNFTYHDTGQHTPHLVDQKG